MGRKRARSVKISKTDERRSALSGRLEPDVHPSPRKLALRSSPTPSPSPTPLTTEASSSAPPLRRASDQSTFAAPPAIPCFVHGERGLSSDALALRRRVVALLLSLGRRVGEEAPRLARSILSSTASLPSYDWAIDARHGPSLVLGACVPSDYVLGIASVDIFCVIVLETTALCDNARQGTLWDIAGSLCEHSAQGVSGVRERERERERERLLHSSVAGERGVRAKRTSARKQDAVLAARERDSCLLLSALSFSTHVCLPCSSSSFP